MLSLVFVVAVFQAVPLANKICCQKIFAQFAQIKNSEPTNASQNGSQTICTIKRLHLAKLGIPKHAEQEHRAFNGLKPPKWVIM